MHGLHGRAGPIAYARRMPTAAARLVRVPPQQSGTLLRNTAQIPSARTLQELIRKSVNKPYQRTAAARKSRMFFTATVTVPPGASLLLVQQRYNPLANGLVNLSLEF